MIYIFLSHDVEWGRIGPPISHILARRERFDEHILKKCQSSNPYYNFPEYMEIEEKLGVRSTFFFRTYVKNTSYPPPPYHVEEYKSEIRSLIRGGWEVGLHLDPSSYKSTRMIQQEKKTLENVAGVLIHGNRVHYTMNNDLLHKNLQKLSFKYDSSAKFSRDKIVDEDFGYFKKEKLVIFPITIMDALAFTYFVKNENAVFGFVKNVVSRCRKLPRKARIMTIVWHDCVLKMKKGRRYAEVLEYLTSLKNAEVKRGIDLFEMVDEGVL